MKNRILLGALAVATVAMFGACADQPTDPMADIDFDLTAMYGKGNGNGNGNGASGAMPGVPDDFDLSKYDDNGDGFVCVKTVPASGKGRAPTRTIIKDTFDDGTCPGGFELTAVAALPACDPGVLYNDTTSCTCEDGWLNPAPNVYFCGTF